MGFLNDYNNRRNKRKDEEEERQRDSVSSFGKRVGREEKTGSSFMSQLGNVSKDVFRTETPSTNPYDIAIETARNYNTPLGSYGVNKDLLTRNNNVDTGFMEKPSVFEQTGYSDEQLKQMEDDLRVQRRDIAMGMTRNNIAPIENNKEDNIIPFEDYLKGNLENDLLSRSNLNILQDRQKTYDNDLDNYGVNKDLLDLNSRQNQLDVSQDLQNKLLTPEEANEKLNETDSQLDWVKDAQERNYYNSIPQAEDFDEYKNYDVGMTVAEQIQNGSRVNTVVQPKSEAEKVAYGLNYERENGTLGEYKYATADEVEVFNYLLNKEGEDAAMDFYKKLDLPGRMTGQYTDWAAQAAEAHPVIASVESLVASPIKGVGYVGSLIDALSGKELDPNAWYNLPSNLQNAVRSQVANDIINNANNEFMGKVGSFMYQTGMSMGDFLMNMGLGNENLILGVMGAGAASDSVIEAKKRGLSDGQALATGTVAGLAEIVSERVSIEALFNSDAQGIRYIIQNALAEGGEEVESDVINDIADIIINGDKALMRQAYQQYLDAGMSESEAFGKVIGDTALQYSLDFAGGAISGAAMSSVGSVGQYVNQSSIGKTMLNSQDNLDQFVNLGMQSENADTRALAETVAKGDAKKNIIGQLVQKVSYENNLYGNLVNNLRESGETQGMAEAEAEAVMRHITGEELNAQDQEYLNNENVQNALNDVFGGTYDASYANSETANDAYSRAIEMARQKKAERMAPVTNAINNVRNIFGNKKSGAQNNTETENNAQVSEENTQKAEETETQEAVKNMPLSERAKIGAEYSKFRTEVKPVQATLNDVKAVEVTPDGLSVTLNDGQKVNTHQIMDDATRYILQRVERNFNDTQGAEDYIKAYNENVNTTVFNNAAFQMETAGYKGVDYKTVYDNVTKDASFVANGQNIPESFLQDMYAYGVRERNRVSKEMNTKIQKTVTDAIEKFVGITSHEGGEEGQGYYDPKTNEITYGKYTKQSRIETLAHELTHMMRKHVEGNYNQIKDIVLEVLKSSGQYDQIFEDTKKTYTDLDEDGIIEEIVANSMQEMLFNETVINELCEKKPKLAQRILNAIRKAIVELRNVLRGHIGSTESKILSQDIEALENAAKLYAQGLKQMSENMKNAESKEGETKYSKYRLEDFNLEDKMNIKNADDFDFKVFEPTDDRHDVYVKTRNNIKEYNKNNDLGEEYLNNKYLGPIQIKNDGIKHSLNRAFRKNGVGYVTTMLPAYFENSIVINEAGPRDEKSDGAYVLLGMFTSEKGDYIVRTVVDYKNRELNEIGWVYAINTKKESGVASATRDSIPYPPSNYSIADFIEIAKDYYPNDFSKNVADHYGYTREKSNLDNLKYSYASLKSLGADMTSLTEAKSMLEEGKSREDVFRETGWFQGADGKWRYEISDDAMNVNVDSIRNQDNVKNYLDDPDYRKFLRIRDFIATTGEPVPEEHAKEYDELCAKYLRNKDLYLGEVIQHDKLLKAYPFLNEIKVKILGREEMDELTSAAFNPEKMELSIREDYASVPELLKKEILHELQHAIQEYEKLSPGASPSYYARNKKSIYNFDVLKIYNNLRKEKDDLLNNAPKEYLSLLNQFDEAKIQYNRTHDSEYMNQMNTIIDEIDSKFEDIHDKNGSLDIDLFFAREEALLTNYSPSDLYYMTAGEIEARDTAQRSELTEEERKNTYPTRTTDKGVVLRDKKKHLRNEDLKYSLERPGDLERKAIEHFGTTDDYRVAGYMLQDGTLLDFSGAHWLEGESPEYIAQWKKQNDIRQVDHEDIFEVMEADGDNRKQFMDRGNIRLNPEAPGFNLSSKAEPTDAQYRELKEFIREIKRNPHYDASRFYVDIEDTHPNKISYANNLNEDRVINDIKNYYKTGNLPDQLNLNDFRYSLQDDWDYDWESAMAESEEEKIAEGVIAKNDANILEDGFKALKDAKNSGKVNISHRKAVEIAKRYTEKYDSATGAESLATSIEAVFAYIREHDVSYDDMLRVMRDVTLPVVENIRGDEQFTEEYRDFVKSLKGTSISLNESQKKEVAYAYGSMANFRKAVAGRFNIKEDGVNIDSLWPEIVEQSGYRLDEEENSNSQPIALLELLDQMKSDKGTVNRGMSDNQLALDMALNIYTDCFKEMSMNAAQVNEMEVARRLAKTKEILTDSVKKYEDAVDKMYKKMLADTKAQAQAEIDRLKQEYRELTSIEAHERSVDADKRVTELIKRITKLQEEIKEDKARRQTNRLKAAQSRENSRKKNAIKRIVKDLSSRLANPNNNRYIPTNLVQATIDMLECIDFDTKEGRDIAAKVSHMKEVYENYKGEDNSEYDESLYAMIKRLRDIFEKGKTVRRLTSAEIDDVLTIAQAIQTQVRNTNEFIKSEMKKKIDEAAKGVIEDVKATKELGYKRSEENANAYLDTSLNATRFTNRLVNYKEDSNLVKAMDELNEGQHKMMQIQMEVDDMFHDVLSDDKKAHWMTGENLKDLIETDLVDKKGNKVKITPAMRVSLAMHMQNEDNLKHIIYGGLTVPNMEVYNRGEKAAAYKRAAHEIRFITQENLKNLNELRAKVNELNSEEFTNQEREDAWNKYKGAVKSIESEAKAKLQSIINGMTDYEQKFFEASKEYFHNYSGQKINETSMALNGYPKATVENYFPIATDKNYTKRDAEGLKLDQTLEGWGNLKSRVGAKNPIYLENINDVIKGHSDMVSKYAGLAIPIRNFNRMYNYSLAGFEDSVKNAINNQRGEGATRYIDNLLTDLQGSRAVDGGKFGKWLSDRRGDYAGAVLTFNLGVAMKQAASFPTAAAVVGKDAIKHVAGSLNGLDLARTILWPILGKSKTTQAQMDLIKKYTPLVWYRNQGNSTQALADLKNHHTFLDKNAATKFLKDHSINWIQDIDTTTVVKIWKAAEYRISKDTDLEYGTDEYYKEVAKVFNKAVEETQPNYTVMQRPDILRNPNELVKSVVMFKTQSLQNAGILIDSYGNLRAKADEYKANPTEENKTKLKAANKRFRQSVGAIVTANMLFAVMNILAAFVKHKPDKYRDEEGEITAESLLKGVLSDFGSAMAGMALGGSELWEVGSAIASGGRYYGINVPAVEMVNDLVSDTKNLIESDDIDKTLKYAGKVLTDASYFTGVPLKNIADNLKGFGLRVEDALNGNIFSMEAGYERSNKQNANLLYNALESGNQDEFDKVYNRMLGEGYSEEDMYNKQGANNDAGDIVKENYLSGSIDGATATKYLTDLGMNEFDAYVKVSKWDLDNWNSPYAGIVTAIKSEDIEKILEAVKIYENNGYDADKLKDYDMPDIIKNEYIDLYHTNKTEAASLKSAILTYYQACGMSREDAAKKVDKWVE